ncbi:MAG TPA: MG2 domain-containing protein, partial [Thermoanaerobaculia bacterium]|nr:MG2 domain-containing protein [Thermoanaerobaculia bacterium]
MKGVSRPFRLSRSALLLALLAVSSAGSSFLQTPPATPAPSGKGNAVAPQPSPPEADWKEIDRLVSEQKFEEAAALAARRKQAAREKGDEAEWTRALIREVQLRTGLHGYETAVRFLKAEPWPKGLLGRAALELFYAQSLVNYFHAYSWEIQQRERVESSGAVDLKAWTATQIYAEAERAYLRLWTEREALGSEDVKALAEFLEPNSYPSGVRGTLRDALSYLFAALLADTSGWSPAQSNEAFRLDLPGLLRSGQARSVKLDDDGVHPLLRLVAVLDDLETWHQGRGEREGALEAYLERLRRLFASFSEEEDRRRIEKDLEERLSSPADVPWFAVGKAHLAEFVERPDLSGDLVRARAIAEEGRRAYPDSIGGRRCLAIVKRIEAPDYQVRAMQSDGPGRRSILVSHKNVRSLRFRAFALDLAQRVDTAKNQYSVLPNGAELARLIDSMTPRAEWSVALPATPDYRSHSTYVTPPMKEPGLYIVAASGAVNFGGSGFPLVAANFIVSDLVLVTRAVTGSAGGPNAFEVQVLSGETGKPLAGVETVAFRSFWNPERIERVASKTTDTRGLALFESPEPRFGGAVFLFARLGRDLALDMSVFYPYGAAQPPKTSSSLLFTDRSIYRPLQKISWKVLGYRGDPRAGRFEVSPASPVTVTLFDQNNQKIDARTATTNDFGSAAGEFLIPAGRTLGSWRLESSLGGTASIRVEEYKRPTFEVTWKDPAEPLRLNRPARLTGQARYYFGLPVASGSVRWRVTRTPQYFWWSPWSWMPRPVARAQPIAAGTADLKPDGTFEVAFTPEADERLGKGSKDLTYTYRIEADASDEGGETRSASRSFRLGFASVEARVDAPPGFLLESRPGRLRILRTNLDGMPRAGNGSWRIARLEQPEKTMLPADQPPTVTTWAGPLPRGRSSPEDFHTPGDELRPRWNTDYAPERMMRLWKDGAEVAHGELTHDAKGEASLEVSGLPAGAYRLHYRTVDEFGAVFEMPKEFLVGGRKTPLALPAVLAVENASVAVGETARFLVTSGLPDQTLFFDVYSAGRRVERRELYSG